MSFKIEDSRPSCAIQSKVAGGILGYDNHIVIIIRSYQQLHTAWDQNNFKGGPLFF